MNPDACPSTFGRESPEHCFVLVTKSSDRPSPYLKCTKCGRAIAAALIAERDEARQRVATLEARVGHLTSELSSLWSTVDGD